MMQLRPYQAQAKDAVLSEWNKGYQKTLLVLPTGTGKTVVFSKVVENQVSRGGRALILAHRGELLTQAADKLRAACGMDCALEKAEFTSLGSPLRITVGSVQSLAQPKRLERFPHDYFTDIVVDEAHHCLSDSYQRVLDHFPDANILGVTATPDRGDMKNLGQYFDSKAFEYTMPQAIKEKYLCPIKAQMIPLELDISDVKVTNGDFSSGDIGNALEPYLEQIAREMTHYCDGRKTVVFLPLVHISQKFTEILNTYGLRAAEVNGNSADRAEILRDFENGRYDVLCNSMLLTEGWDCPSVDCVVVLRPTKARSLYQQMVGRGMRLHPGKDHLLLLDFLWLSERHDLCRPSAYEKMYPLFQAGTVESEIEKFSDEGLIEVRVTSSGAKYLHLCASGYEKLAKLNKSQQKNVLLKIASFVADGATLMKAFSEAWPYIEVLLEKYVFK